MKHAARWVGGRREVRRRLVNLCAVVGATSVLVASGVVGSQYAAASDGTGATSASATGAGVTSALGATLLAAAAAGSGPTNPPAAGLPEFAVGNSKAPCQFDAATVTCANKRPRLTQLPSILSALTVGTSDLTRVKQAIRLPTTLIGANLIGQYYSYYIKGDQKQYRQSFPTKVFIQSPKGAAHPFGDLPPITSTALAFGFVPVKVTAHLSQQRDAAGLPIPLQIKIDSKIIPPKTDDQDERKIFFDIAATGPVVLRLDNVSIDGNPVDVGSSCQSSTPAQLSFTGKFSPENSAPPTYYYPIYGGDLYGTIGIPAFSGCRTASGEDLSALFTNALSEDGNPVHLTQGSADPFGNLGCPAEPVAALQCTLPVNTDKLTGPGAVPSQPPADENGKPWVPRPTPCDFPAILPNLPAHVETNPTDTCLRDRLTPSS